MSFVFNDTSDKLGLVQQYEDEIGANDGDVSGNTLKLKKFTSYTKTAFDRYFQIALTASGKWQLDDSNHTRYPIIKTDLVSGQRDYSFTVDGQNNLILDIYKVAILPSATATLYEEIHPVDVQSESEAIEILAENTTTGVPYQYDKTANGIFLDPPPSYNATSGLKIYINREASYFVYTDTTKKPGVPGLHHEYFYLYPAYMYARRNNLANKNDLLREVLRIEKDIKDYFGKRSKDERPVMRGKRILYI